MQRISPPSDETKIGWWDYPSFIYTTPPAKTVSLAGRTSSFKVTKADFPGYERDDVFLSGG
jgi:hypothetical protein